jgi:hypothetical protein
MDDGEPQYKGRGTKARNPLLIRAVVGKAKPATFEIPNGHTFGVQKKVDGEGVREVVGNWQSNEPAKVPKKNKKQAKSQTLKPDVTFGKASRPSTPIAGVLSHSYGRQYVSTQQKKDRDDQAKTRDLKHKVMARSFQHTKASQGHQRGPEQAAAKPFKMKRFENVESRVKLPKVSASATVTVTTEIPAKTPEVFVPHDKHASGPKPGESKYTIINPPSTGNNNTEITPIGHIQHGAESPVLANNNANNNSMQPLAALANSVH